MSAAADAVGMVNRRFTHLTNAFSKKLEPQARDPGVTDFLWSMEDIVMMWETMA
jgi:hypothetical protein